MIKTFKLFRNSVKLAQAHLRFANNIQEPKAVTTQGTEQPTSAEEIPVHLRPYDKKKYEVPSSKIKVFLVLITS